MLLIGAAHGNAESQSHRGWGSRGQPRGVPGLAAAALHPARMSDGQTWPAHPAGGHRRWVSGAMPGQEPGRTRRGRKFAFKGLKSSCTHGCRWGKSSLGSSSAGAQDQDPSTGAPSQPHCHQAMCSCPLFGLALSSQGAGGCWSSPGCLAGRGPSAMGCKGWCAGSGRGPAGSSARSAVSPGQGQKEARLRHCHLPCQTPIPEEALSAVNALQQPPQSLRLGKMLQDCICSKWIVSGGEQSTGEFSKQSRDRSPQERQPVPSSGTSLGTQRGAGSAPKPTRQQAGAPQLSPPSPTTAVPQWWPGRSH